MLTKDPQDTFSRDFAMVIALTDQYMYDDTGTCKFTYLFNLNTLRPRQNDRHFADSIFKCIFLNENFRISNKISLKFVPKGPIKQYSSTGSDNGLAPNRRQAIIWINDRQCWRRLYASLGLNEL